MRWSSPVSRHGFILIIVRRHGFVLLIAERQKSLLCFFFCPISHVSIQRLSYCRRASSGAAGSRSIESLDTC